MKTYHTGMRDELLRTFKERSHTALTLSDLTAALLPDGHGKSTLYRQLAALVDEGLVRKTSDGHTRHFTYQYVPCAEGGNPAALHLKCKVCGRLLHLDLTTARMLFSALKRNLRFSLDGEQTFLIGTCDRCLHDGSHIL